MWESRRRLLLRSFITFEPTATRRRGSPVSAAMLRIHPLKWESALLNGRMILMVRTIALHPN
jgi:hypothetical protein